jgi:DNA-binding NarL/FixJ family response regulator
VIRIDVLDTSPVFLYGLVEILSHEDIEVLGVRAHPSEERPPGVDVAMIEVNALAPLGHEALPYVSRTAALCRVLMVAASPQSPIEPYLTAGVAGVITKQDEPKAVVEAIRAAATLDPVSAPSTIPVVREPCASLDSAPLSEREVEVLRYICSGLTHRQVARRMGISRNTVDTYVKRIRIKLGPGNKAELTRAALVHGYLQQPATIQP